MILSYRFPRTLQYVMLRTDLRSANEKQPMDRPPSTANSLIGSVGLITQPLQFTVSTRDEANEANILSGVLNFVPIALECTSLICLTIFHALIFSNLLVSLGIIGICMLTTCSLLSDPKPPLDLSHHVPLPASFLGERARLHRIYQDLQPTVR